VCRPALTKTVITELTWFKCRFDELTNGQAVMHYQQALSNGVGGLRDYAHVRVNQ